MRLFETAANERGIGERGRKHCLFYATKSGALTKLQYTLATIPFLDRDQCLQELTLATRKAPHCCLQGSRQGARTLHIRLDHRLSIFAKATG